jgi:ribosome-binding protein aMBF1 (putative translation factor)
MYSDFKVVILRKSGKESGNIKRKRGETTTVAKNQHSQKKKILDQNLDSFTTETVSYTLKMQIQKARVAAKLSQKNLAQKINVTQKTIQTYENGTAVPDNKVLQKLRRILKVKLEK